MVNVHENTVLLQKILFCRYWFYELLLVIYHYLNILHFFQKKLAIYHILQIDLVIVSATRRSRDIKIWLCLLDLVQKSLKQ